MNFQNLKKMGFDLSFQNHAETILVTDFADQVAELTSVLMQFELPAYELIRGGGGESQATRFLRNQFAALHWKKHKFEIRKIVDSKEISSTSHEVDHVRLSKSGNLALEIEWNNKDPFFDRDLENFKRLHLENAISVGIIITRGQSLQKNLEQIIQKCAKLHGVKDFDDLNNQFSYKPTDRQRKSISLDISSVSEFQSKWSQKFKSDKFGVSTTHWKKLEDRISRGVGNPCPLCLIGIPDSVIKQTIQT